ncbi:MAG: alcohol dehydrogenase catalytic domain-containing protein, partial [Candidatus Thorarchaeota archaeon]
MSSSRALGYAAKGVGQLLEPISYDLPKLGEHDVQVSITHCGVCHTDIHAIDDYYGITDYPFVPGHEIVGTVSDIGRSVYNLKEGDRVGVGWQGRSCMQCEWCLQGEEQLYMDIVRSGTWVPYG